MLSGSRHAGLVTSLCMLALGAGLIAWASVSAYRTHEVVRGSVSADAIIVQMVEWRTTLHRRAVYRPIFRFQTGDGHSYTLRSNTGSNPPEFRAGQHVTVFFPDGHPERARIESFVDLYIFNLFWMAFGLAAAAFGFFAARAATRRLPDLPGSGPPVPTADSKR